MIGTFERYRNCLFSKSTVKRAKDNLDFEPSLPYVCDDGIKLFYQNYKPFESQSKIM